MEEKQKYISFAVGPVQMYDRIRKIGASEPPYFRTPTFAKLMQENEDMLKQLVGATPSDRAIFLTSSGSGAMEAAVLNMFSKDDFLLIIDGGTFGERFVNICLTHHIPFLTIKVKPGETLTKEMLKRAEGIYLTGILINMHETSTGTLYDMKMVSEFAARRNVKLVVDAISAFISEEINMHTMGADVLLIGGQKGLAIPPGIAPVILSKRALDHLTKRTAPVFYFDFLRYVNSSTPFTPAITVLLQLHARLKELMNGGFLQEQQTINRRAVMFRRKIKKYPFTLFSKSPANCLTSLRVLRADISGEQIINILRDRYHIILAASMGTLKQEMFRVGHIGNLKKKDYDALFAAFDDMVARHEL